MRHFFTILPIPLMKLITMAFLICHIAMATALAGENQAAFDKARMEELVKRSYQYAVMYHINNRIALDPSFARFTGGYNKFMTAVDLFDHTAKGVARPNNDTLYLAAMLDLRKDSVILELPAFDSGYVLMMATGYDYYVNIPMSTTKGDFQKPEKVLFHTARTEGYKGGKVEGVDRAVEMSCDFVSVILHVMPHASDKARFERVRGQMKAIRLRTRG